MTHTPTLPTRRTLLAGALGVGALGSVAAASPGAAALGDPTIPSNPGVDFYLALTSILGTSTTVGYEGQIPLLTWAWGVATPTSNGGGSGVGRPVPEDFVFAASTGIHSPKVLAAANTSRRLQRALLSCVSPDDGRGFLFQTIRLDDVQVTGYDVTPSATDGFPLDVVSLSFAKITYRVTARKPDGTTGDTVTSSYDYRTGAAS